MSQKKRVAILFGGKSAEHEISLISAMNIIAAINRTQYEPVLIGIDKTGRWILQNETRFMANPADPRKVQLTDAAEQLSVIPGDTGPQLYNLHTGKTLEAIDVIFPIVHGPLGEDGSLQGLLRLLNLAFVGPDVLGSAICMDKDVAKRLMNEAGIPNARFRSFRKEDDAEIHSEKIAADLGLPLFVKPANMGSSVGISKVESAADLQDAVDEAFRFDTKIIIEEFIKGREIECAVMGNENPEASVPGEVIPHSGFYSYEAKYVDESAAGLEAPAKNLSEEQVRQIQALAIRAYRTLECEGLSRVDFFLKADGKLYLNEINTLPGFTKISMFPGLWGQSGIPYRELIDRLLRLAMERQKVRGGLDTQSPTSG